MGSPTFLEPRGFRLILFGGKGGVGKTTCAAAAGLRLAQVLPGSGFLLVSSDPAHSLTDSMAGAPPPPNLRILELDASQCLTIFRSENAGKLREIASRGTFLDEEDINQLLALSLPGLDELMAFLEISRLVEDRAYDCILVDTAPTGHTLRLLAMPGLLRKWILALDALLAKHRYLRLVFGGSERRDSLDVFLGGLAASVDRMESLLHDPARCGFVPVTLPERLSVCETVALVQELERLQVPIRDIVVNRLYPDTGCPLCEAERARQDRELRDGVLDSGLSQYVLWGVPFSPVEVRGPEALSRFWDGVVSLPGPMAVSTPALRAPPVRVEGPAEHPPPSLTLLLFAGKGGVGKTTLACATAVRLADESRDKRILLVSVDPAHSLSDCLGIKVGAEPAPLSRNLSAVEIDAQSEFEAFRRLYLEELESFCETLLKNLDLPFDREVLERILDLSPTGLDEVMAVTRIMKYLEEGVYDLLVLDTAATGHLIRLLELPELINQWLRTFFGLFLKYQQIFRLPNVSRRLVEVSKSLRKLRSLLRDPARTAAYAVSIAAEMSLEETRDLAAAWDRMGIRMAALFINLLTPAGGCRFCSLVHREESAARREFQRTFRGQRQILVYRQGDVRGLPQLRKLGEGLYEPALRESLSYAG